MRKDVDRLHDIGEAIKRIEAYAEKGWEVFQADEMLQVWMLYHIQIIGEAASKISDELRLTFDAVPWNEIVAMRNVLVHDYFGIDLIEVWNTVEKDIPELSEQIYTILDTLDVNR